MLRLYGMIADGADCVLPVRPPKNRVGGRYLATFSSNCFAINENQVAELVAAAILVATYLARRETALTTKDTKEVWDLLTPSRTGAARAGMPAGALRWSLAGNASRIRTH